MPKLKRGASRIKKEKQIEAIKKSIQERRNKKNEVKRTRLAKNKSKGLA